MSDLRVVGAIRGNAFDRRTWSGASHHLFSALRAEVDLLDVVDVSAPVAVERLAKATAFHPRMRRWREKYEYSSVTRLVESRVGARRIAAVDQAPDVLLQIGAYYDFAASPGPRPKVRCSYHDANLALFTRQWTYVEDASARHVSRTMQAERRVLDRLDVIFAMSEWLRSSFVEDFGQDPEKVVVVGAGVNNPMLPPPIERQWDSPSVLFVGFEWERKGGPAVLDAFRRLCETHEGATLRVVGPPRPSGMALPPRVEWIGPVDRSTPDGDRRMDELHRQATVLALAPTYDPFPNAVLEAMAYGLPVVGVRRGSMPETVAHGETGLLTEHGTADELAGALDELAHAPKRAFRLGSAGRSRVHARFTWRHVAARMREAMTQV